MKKIIAMLSLSVCMLLLFFLTNQKFQAHADGGVCDSVTDVPVSECEALVAIAQANTGSNLTTLGGWSQAYGTDPITNVCDWGNVTCSL